MPNKAKRANAKHNRQQCGSAQQKFTVDKNDGRTAILQDKNNVPHHNKKEDAKPNPKKPQQQKLRKNKQNNSNPICLRILIHLFDPSPFLFFLLLLNIN